MSDTARRILLGIFLFGLAGLSVELWLLEHTEDAYQLIPLVLAAAAFAGAVALASRPSIGSVRLFQALMVLLLMSGVLGTYLHYQVTTEFQLEMDPTLRGWALFEKAIRAKAPPALAPGSMIQLGLIGLAYTFKHPATSRRTP